MEFQDRSSLKPERWVGVGGKISAMMLATLGLLVVSQAVGCGKGNTYVAPPPPDVTVARPTVRSVTDYLEYTGTTRAVLRVELDVLEGKFELAEPSLWRDVGTAATSRGCRHRRYPA